MEECNVCEIIRQVGKNFLTYFPFGFFTPESDDNKLLENITQIFKPNNN